jgi:hypothetical protein
LHAIKLFYIENFIAVNKNMHNCFQSNYKFDANNIVPLKINDKPYLACTLEYLLDISEIVELENYVQKLFSAQKCLGRKKYAIIENKLACKNICKRWKIPKYKIDEKVYKFKKYMPNIEVIQWQKNMPLYDINFDKITAKKYCRNDIINYVISPSNISSRTTVTPKLLSDNNSDSDTKDIILTDKRALLWCNNSISLQETMNTCDNTQIYFHCKYTSL